MGCLKHYKMIVMVKDEDGSAYNLHLNYAVELIEKRNVELLIDRS